MTNLFIYKNIYVYGEIYIHYFYYDHNFMFDRLPQRCLERCGKHLHRVTSFTALNLGVPVHSHYSFHCLQIQHIRPSL